MISCPLLRVTLLGVKSSNPIKRVNTCQLFPAVAALFCLYNVMQQWDDGAERRALAHCWFSKIYSYLDCPGRV